MVELRRNGLLDPVIRILFGPHNVALRRLGGDDLDAKRFLRENQGAIIRLVEGDGRNDVLDLELAVFATNELTGRDELLGNNVAASALVYCDALALAVNEYSCILTVVDVDVLIDAGRIDVEVGGLILNTPFISLQFAFGRTLVRGRLGGNRNSRLGRNVLSMIRL